MRIRRWRPSLCGLVALLLTASCGPRPVYHLTPVVRDVRWDWGRETVSTERSDYIASIAFNRPQGRDLLFDIDITNTSGRQLVVSPAEFFYVPIPAPPDQKVKARDPEAILAGIDRSLAREDARREDDDTFLSALFVVMASADLLALSEGQVPEGASERYANLAQDAMDNETTYADRQRALEAERAYWETGPLRRTTLAPGERIMGQVLFPARDDGAHLRVVLPIGETAAEFTFKQDRIN